MNFIIMSKACRLSALVMLLKESRLMEEMGNTPGYADPQIWLPQVPTLDMNPAQPALLKVAKSSRWARTVRLP
jgi:hypothetical protein